MFANPGALSRRDPILYETIVVNVVRHTAHRGTRKGYGVTSSEVSYDVADFLVGVVDQLRLPIKDHGGSRAGIVG